MTVIGGTALLLAGLVVLIVLGHRRRQFNLKGELALLPAKVINPRQFAHLKTIRAWELTVENLPQACTWARETDGKRFRTHVAVPLPIAGCGRTCTCQYLPVTENRRRQRRLHALDQPELNLGDSTSPDRRDRRGRRQEDRWGGDQRR